MPSTVDTCDAPAVAAAVRAIQRRLFPDASPVFIERLFADVDDMFAGRTKGLQAADLRYHDQQHTLQASLCMAKLLAGWHSAGTGATLSARCFELGLAAIILHDTGYLKQHGDGEGTGAKYTYTHVLRSCAVAASLRTG